MKCKLLVLLIAGAITTIAPRSGFAQGEPLRRPSPKQWVGKSGTTARDKILLLKILKQLSEDDLPIVLSGQNLGHGNFDPIQSYLRNVERLGRHTGRLPAILGADYGYDEFPQDFSETNHLLHRHYKALGLVTVSMHPPNPWQQSDCHDLRIGDLRELTTPGTESFRRWRETLDHVADGLRQLQQLDVVVLWRPLHEMNGGWFWWGAHADNEWVSQEEFVAVWKDMHRYFREAKGLDNLLWVYSAAVQNSEAERSAIHYYPGDAYVDVVGLDWYDDTLKDLDKWQSYSQLAALKKPLGLTEFGPLSRRDGSFHNQTLIREIAEKYPKIGFFLFWHSWPGANVAIVDNAGSRRLMRDKRVTTIEHSSRPLAGADDDDQSSPKPRRKPRS
jgi:mannan endo-1,4-beta-mannosidase